MADSTTDQPQQPEQQQQQQQSNPFINIFTTFRDELDEHHDRRERIIKASRDITALSKKIIFALQRVRTLNTSLPASLTKETTTRFNQITTHFTSLLPDLRPAPNTHRYMRQLSPAIQEFIEALSFHHYLTTQTLITLDEVRKHLPEGILVTEEDYLLGLFDLTGEMMRFAEQKGIVVDLREMRCGFEGLSVPGRHRGVMLRDMGKKVDVMQGSVEKVERAAYGILVRGRERPKGWRPDLVVGGGGMGGEDEY
ncbi:hypothetical protein CAN33_0033800 [Aspergillus niger]|uniref:Translin-associated factor TraX n=1 Tax=Aspergillus niger TaxID=5061 RepID=A0A505HZW7_ASPNG|nr:hypothetical protein CAN33_0033800 [Aspergillus niger]